MLASRKLAHDVKLNEMFLGWVSGACWVGGTYAIKPGYERIRDSLDFLVGHRPISSPGDNRAGHPSDLFERRLTVDQLRRPSVHLFSHRQSRAAITAAGPPSRIVTRIISSPSARAGPRRQGDRCKPRTVRRIHFGGQRGYPPRP